MQVLSTTRRRDRAHPSGPGKVRLTMLALVGAAFALGHAPARATSLELEGTADLLEKSNSVVVGTVVATEARMREEHQFIYTYVTLQVDEVLKGTAVAAGRTIVLEELGGQVGRWIHHVDAVPQYQSGERVLAFLEDRPDDLFRTYGMIQGKFRFESDVRTGEAVLTRPKEWTDTYFAALSAPRDLTVVRADGSYAAEPLLAAIRDWVQLH